MMKKILIPTDFSVPAENAARYGLELAKVLKADVLLCNAIKVPAQAPMAAQVAWPLMDYADLKKEISGDLDELVKTLTGSCFSEEQYCPTVTYETSIGEVYEVVSTLVKEKKIEMVVMGIAGAGGLTQFVLGSNSKEMIEKAEIPLLLVPFEANFKQIRKIAFATDFDDQDIASLQFIAKFAASFDAKVIIVHITNKEVAADGKMQSKIDAFLSRVTMDVNYPHIKFEYVWNIDIDNGLEWVAEQKELDMIAIGHRRHNLLERLFKGSHTQKLSRHTKIPLLVFSQQ
ncbi:universal stress protein [Pedobacter foliorum]|uniref:universal stress protein n=1 Tax=Pedobacter foliorum TaxID=2739058 RepID=UPI001566E2D8|nr:universal stress protein [Pedobacter foliorum]NRF37691.1 universal stress protein [Pedobacter foliorum]